MSALPRAPLAFRVGVVGHRPDRLMKANPEQLAGVLQNILGAVKQEVLRVKEESAGIYDTAGAVLRAVSPLAEGTDRIFAVQALNLHFELCCVMPFHQAEFETDFAPGQPLEEFRRLLKRTTTRFQLDGSHAEEGGAYESAGRVVLNQSDLLIVVWDGERQGKRGGTENTFDEARSCGVPIVWIDAYAPHRWQVLNPGAPAPELQQNKRAEPNNAAADEALQTCVRQALAMPRPSADEESEDPMLGLQRFYAERQPRWTLAVVWKAFRDIVADTVLPRIRFSVPNFDEATKIEWPDDQTSPIARLVDQLRPFYAWPDKLAVLYADRYRSAFILAFFLAAMAVGVALVPVGARLPSHHVIEITCIALELAAIVTILTLVFVGRKCRWHERWLDYRVVAELIRHLRLVAPLGGGRPFPQVPAQWATYGQPESTWMAWYVRAVERWLGLPTAVVNSAHLDASLHHLTRLIEHQIEFHALNERRCHAVEHRLHRWGMGLLGLTLVCGLVHLLTTQPPWLPPVLTFCCGFLPAMGAALAGISNQGEFRRISKRSTGMQEHLEMLLKQIDGVRKDIASGVSFGQPCSARVATLAADTTRLLVNEVLDWRVVFLDQPLKPPA